MLLKKQIQKIKIKLAEDVKLALDLCISLTQHDDFILLQTRYASTKKQLVLGTISFQEFLQIQNGIVFGILETLKGYEDKKK